MNKKYKKYLALGLLSFLLVGGISAYYFFYYEKNIVGGTSNSQQDLEVISDFEDSFILDLNENLEHINTLTLKNNNPESVNMVISWNITEENLDVNCSVNEDDLVITLEQNGIELFDGDNITLVNGITEFIINTEAKNNRICPTNIINNFVLEEIIE